MAGRPTGQGPESCSRDLGRPERWSPSPGSSRSSPTTRPRLAAAWSRLRTSPAGSIAAAWPRRAASPSVRRPRPTTAARSRAFFGSGPARSVRVLSSYSPASAPSLPASAASMAATTSGGGGKPAFFTAPAHFDADSSARQGGTTPRPQVASRTGGDEAGGPGGGASGGPAAIPSATQSGTSVGGRSSTS